MLSILWITYVGVEFLAYVAILCLISWGNVKLFGWNILHSQQQCTRVPVFFFYILINSCYFPFLNYNHPSGGCSSIFVILICISLMSHGCIQDLSQTPELALMLNLFILTVLTCFCLYAFIKKAKYGWVVGIFSVPSSNILSLISQKTLSMWCLELIFSLLASNYSPPTWGWVPLPSRYPIQQDPRSIHLSFLHLVHGKHSCILALFISEVCAEFTAATFSLFTCQSCCPANGHPVFILGRSLTLSHSVHQPQGHTYQALWVIPGILSLSSGLKGNWASQQFPLGAFYNYPLLPTLCPPSLPLSISSSLPLSLFLCLTEYSSITQAGVHWCDHSLL